MYQTAVQAREPTYTSSTAGNPIFADPSLALDEAGVLLRFRLLQQVRLKPLFEMSMSKCGTAWATHHGSAIVSVKGFSMLVRGLPRRGEVDLGWRLLDQFVLNQINRGAAALGFWFHACRHQHLDLS